VANDTAKRLLARVRALREALGLSQEAFAERAGMKYKHYQSVEAGRKLDFKFSTLEKIAKACDLTLTELLDFDAAIPEVAEEPGKHRFQGPTGAGKKVRKTRKPRPKEGE